MEIEQTTQFCEALFRDVPHGLWTNFWTLASKQSHWVEIGGATELAPLAVELAANSDVYVAVSVARTALGPNRRTTSEESAGLMGLWADVDIADPDTHKKWNLPPDEASARSLLDAVGLEPTILLHSGHGLQAWWLFDEFWEFDSDEARSEAALLAQSWNTTLRVRAAERDWTVDSTFDLARVMRVPGTVNLKGEPVPVTLLDCNTERRYGLEDFEQHSVDDGELRKLGLRPTREYVVSDGLKLNKDAQPPFDKFNALIDAEPMFKASWDRKRRDLQDQSPSSYDLSLASLSVMAGWTDQEIADLIVASRRKFSDDLKLRLDYYTRTIARSHETMDRVTSMEEMDEVAEQLKHARRTGDDDDVKEKRRAVLESMSNQLTIEVVGVIKYRSTPPAYRLETPTGGIDLGDSSQVISWSIMRAKVAGETNVLIPRFNTGSWDRLVQMIFEVCEEVDTGMESTEVGQVFLWLSEYLLTHEPVDDHAQAAISEYPFQEGDGPVMIFGAAFRRWLWMSRGERITQRELGRMLRLYGCAPQRMNVNVEGQRTTRSVWTLPISKETK